MDVDLAPWLKIHIIFDAHHIGVGVKSTHIFYSVYSLTGMAFSFISTFTINYQISLLVINNFYLFIIGCSNKYPQFVLFHFFFF